MTPSAPERGWWTVVRHGGRRTDKKRIVFSGGCHAAWQRFEDEKVKMRQGTVELFDNLNTRQAHTWAPNLRTRW